MDYVRLIDGRYQTGAAIGSGATGCVFLGTDLWTGELVAVKAIRCELLAVEPELVERCRREAEALRELHHPNIVKLLATADEGDEHYLVMEYAGAGSLGDLLERQPQLPIDQAISIGRGLAAALAHVHQMGILHRDIKPSNILLTDDGAPHLTDFGLARLRCCTGLTTADSLLGTFQYVSPEAWHKSRLDQRADIWSFGVVMYEMLAGVRPFDGDSPYEIMWAINNQPLPDLECYRAGVPAALVELIRQMLMRDVSARIASAREVEEQLKHMGQQNRVGM